MQLLVNKNFFCQSSFYLSNFAYQCRGYWPGELLAWYLCLCLGWQHSRQRLCEECFKFHAAYTCASIQSHKHTHDLCTARCR